MFGAKKYFYECRHFTQVDPSKAMPSTNLEFIMGRGSDAIIVAGTQDVTEQKAINIIKLASQKTDKHVYFAPSHPDQVGKQIIELVRQDIASGLVIYHPLNSKNQEIANWPETWYEKIKQKDIGEIIEDKFLGDYCIDIGYIVTNPYSAVGKIVKPELSGEKICKYAENCKFDILYLDGSGKKVSPKLIEDVREKFSSFLIVGGGLETYNDAKTVFESGADAIVVGRVLEEGNTKGYLDTIEAVKAMAEAKAKSVVLSHA